MTAPLAARRLALFALCSALAACDSGGTDPDDLVGSWSLDAVSLSIVATSDETQEGLDLAAPGAGSLAVTGDVSARPLYLGARGFDEDGETTSVTLTDVSLAGPADRVALDLSANSAELRVITEDGELVQTFALDEFDGDAVATFDEDGVEVERARLVDAASGDAVTVRGTLTYARRTYPEDEEVDVLTQSAAEPEFALLGAYDRVTFREDGDFEAVPADPEAEDVEGTWTAGDDGEVRIRTDGAGSIVYRFETSGSTLRLTADVADLGLDVNTDCDAACVANLERLIDLDEGTVDDVRFDLTFRFTRRGSDDDRPARAASRRVAPARLWPLSLGR